jgi:hypothetical protein
VSPASRWLAALLLAAALAPAGAAAKGPLSVRQEGPAFAGRPLTLRVAPIQVGGQPRFQFSVIAPDRGSALLATVAVPPRGGTVAVPTAKLGAGRHRLLVRSATLVTEVEVRVLPWATLPAAAAVLLAVLVLVARAAGGARERPELF